METLTEKCPYCDQAVTRSMFEKIRTRIRQEEQEKITALAAETRKRLKQELDQKYAREMQSQKVAYKKLADDAIVKATAQFSREREAWQKKVLDLERRVSQRTPHELGDGPERDLEQVLREAFTDDGIERVAKGESGADVIQEVKYKGQACGAIIYDSKNHKGWRTDFIAKIKGDMIRHGATYSVIVSSSFPAGQDGFCVQDGVVVIRPTQVIYIAHILRSSMVALYRQGLSAQERDSKMAALYHYLGSGEFSARLKEAIDLIARLEQLDTDEREIHEKTWKSRSRSFGRMTAALGDVDARIGGIMDSGGEDEKGEEPPLTAVAS